MRAGYSIWAVAGVVALSAHDTPQFAINYALRARTPAPVTDKQEAASPDMTLSTSRVRDTPIDLAVQRYEAMNGRPFLIAPEQQFEPGGAYGVLKKAAFDPITRPEVVRIGKVQLTGGVVGAVKKKNPFYLLNPLVFALDW